MKINMFRLCAERKITTSLFSEYQMARKKVATDTSDHSCWEKSQQKIYNANETRTQTQARSLL